MAKVLRRPTKEMMLTVNASIAGNKKKVNELLKEHRLSRRQLDARLEIRDGEKYDLRKKGGRPKGSSTKTTRALAQPAKRTSLAGDGIPTTIDGRTSLVSLVQVEARVHELLGQKPKTQVEKVRKAVVEVEVLRKKYEDARAVLGIG